MDEEHQIKRAPDATAQPNKTNVPVKRTNRREFLEKMEQVYRGPTSSRWFRRAC